MPSTTGKTILKAATLIAGGAALLLTYINLAAPRGLLLRCPVKWATGLSCPGCGSQRALAAVMEGDLHTALTVNLLLPPLAIYLIALLACRIAAGTQKAGKPATRAARMQRSLTSPTALWTILAAVAAWTVIRNLLSI